MRPMLDGDLYAAVWRVIYLPRKLDHRWVWLDQDGRRWFVNRVTHGGLARVYAFGGRDECAVWLDTHVSLCGRWQFENYAPILPSGVRT